MIAARDVAHLLFGIVLGVAYFRTLWWNARRLADGTSWKTTAALIVVRITILAGVLALVSFEGALPLLATALGVLLGRVLVMRRVAKVAL